MSVCGKRSQRSNTPLTGDPDLLQLGFIVLAIFSVGYKNLVFSTANRQDMGIR